MIAPLLDGEPRRDSQRIQGRAVVLSLGAATLLLATGSFSSWVLLAEHRWHCTPQPLPAQTDATQPKPTGAYFLELSTQKLETSQMENSGNEISGTSEDEDCLVAPCHCRFLAFLIILAGGLLLSTFSLLLLLHHVTTARMDTVEVAPEDAIEPVSSPGLCRRLRQMVNAEPVSLLGLFLMCISMNAGCAYIACIACADCLDGCPP
mgnify:CR=1 FL=1